MNFTLKRNINRYLKSIGIKRRERIEIIQEFEWKFYPLVQKAMGEGPAYCTGIGFNPIQLLVLKNVFGCEPRDVKEKVYTNTYIFKI